MELQEREKVTLMSYAFRIGYYSKSERIEARKAINEDLNDLLEKDKLSKEEYDEMFKKLDEIDEDMKDTIKLVITGKPEQVKEAIKAINEQDLIK